MNFGFVKIGAYTPKVKVADVNFNTNEIKKGILQASEKGVKVLAFPELCVTGYTCGDLFYQDALLNLSNLALKEIAQETKGKKMLVIVGAPYKFNGLIYNVAVAMNDGKIIGVIPKSYLPNYNEFYEKRHFAPAFNNLFFIEDMCEGEKIPFSKNIIFKDKNYKALQVAVELCEDLWAPVPPSIFHAVNGANLIVNLSCSDECVGKPDERLNLVLSHSKKIVSGYLYANAGEGESTTDAVFSGHNVIAENGQLIAQSQLFSTGLITADIDVEEINFKRSKLFNQEFNIESSEYLNVEFNAVEELTGDLSLDRQIALTPFIPKLDKDYKLILDMQAEGLKKRIEHVNASTLVLGLSGGLDSTLALIASVNAFNKLNKPLKDIIAVTMPCFGTTSRTFDNSVKLARAFKVTLKKIDIKKSVLRHFKDIKQDQNIKDVTFENSQARERTQILMDLANKYNGLVVGTGDLSELALGFATYNGDHMSNYAVNASVSKTLVRSLTKFYANGCKPSLKSVLLDVIDTPVSPELLPSENGNIKQQTEDIVGPYILHDFFLYNMLVNGYSPKKIFAVAKIGFKNQFDQKTILKWLKIFVRRFFNQQFKRSCMPDGVKIGEVSLSPRGSYRMPSDACATIWLKELEEMEAKFNA